MEENPQRRGSGQFSPVVGSDPPTLRSIAEQTAVPPAKRKVPPAKRKVVVRPGPVRSEAETLAGGARVFHRSAGVSSPTRAARPLSEFLLTLAAERSLPSVRPFHERALC